MAMGEIIYLEKFVESTAYLPPELQRILNTIKDLDERSEDLAAQIQDNVEAALNKSPSPSGRKNSSGADEVAELRARIEADQRLLIQFSEEKVQLAVQGYDLLEAHYNQLNVDIADFTQELQAKGMDPLGDSFMGLEDSVTKGGGGGGGRGPTTRFDSFDSLEPSVMEVKLPRKAAQEKATTPAPALAPPPQQLGADGYATGRRRAAQAAVHAAAAAVAAMDADEEFHDDGAMPAAAGAGGGLGGGMAAAPPPVAGGGTLSAMAGPVPGGLPGGEAMAAAPPLQPFTFPQQLNGLTHAAENPQVAGRLLTYADISPALVGKRGELFWPDDNMWYLVEIHSVDLENRKANILYMTGEAEELDLDEIVKEGHLTLHTV